MIAQIDTSRLSPVQQTLVHRVSNAEPGDRLHITGPVGSGKTYAAAAAVSELCAQRPEANVLIIVALAPTQWERCFRLWGASAIRLTRELAARMSQELAPDGLETWSGGLVLATQQFASRKPIPEPLMRVDWDVIVLDSPNALMMDAAECLLQAPNAPALLLISEGDSPNIADGFQGAFDWDRRFPASSLGRSGSAMLRRHWVPYSRSSQEQALLHRVHSLAKTMPGVASSALLRRSVSSPAGLEVSLLSWASRPLEANGLELEGLLSDVEASTEDSKLNALLGALPPLAEAPRTVVFADYRDTCEYLRASLDSHGHPAFTIHGGLPADEREARLQEFESGEGTLVVTTAATRGLEFGANVAVHYDLPINLTTLYVRESRLKLLNRAEPCDVYTLEDITGSSPLETAILRVFKRVAREGALDSNDPIAAAVAGVLEDR